MSSAGEAPEASNPAESAAQAAAAQAAAEAAAARAAADAHAANRLALAAAPGGEPGELAAEPSDIQVATGEAVVQLANTTAALEFKWQIAHTRQQVASKVPRVSDPQLAKKVDRYAAMLVDMAEAKVRVGALPVPAAQKAPVVALLNGIGNRLGLEMSIPVIKEMSGDFKVGEQYAETLGPHAMQPIGKYADFDFMAIDEKLLGKVRARMALAAPAAAYGGRQPGRGAGPSQWGDRRGGYNKRYDGGRGSGYDARGGGGQLKRPRDEGKPNDAGQYPARY